MPRASKLLPSIGHAASGACGTVVSTLATYPLDLVNTRLKVQRQLRADGSIRAEDAYSGILDAFASIYAKEGGLSAFTAGLGADLAKSAADSFLFFLFYTVSPPTAITMSFGRGIEGERLMGVQQWFRARRLGNRKDTSTPYLRAVEELAVGAAAGACAKLFTTPASSVVTRRQTASLLDASSGAGGGMNGDTAAHQQQRDMTFGEIVSAIRRERGLLGLWAGYSASLVLTLNPSATFFLQQILKRALVPREKWDVPGAWVTFLLAALSKVAATAMMYPFQIAKARMQVSGTPEKRDGEKKTRRGGRGLAKETIFATVVRIARSEGPTALYDGIGGELLKGFFSHGTTMLSKDIIHRFIVQLYFTILAILKGYPQLRLRFFERMRNTREEVRRRYLQASSAGAKDIRGGARHVKELFDRTIKVSLSLWSGS
ncbi:mitochondrial carrier [Canariomyces notabilis]|uniref:Mitochondrial carrier n=1 Tax=Canariomyces notabilis TaxID=2074819 RepID=A0AAN6YUA7_9PEZI|nr:mitochondrial carrier [Canariomyces arenarius]